MHARVQSVQCNMQQECWCSQPRPGLADLSSDASPQRLEIAQAGHRGMPRSLAAS